MMEHRLYWCPMCRGTQLRWVQVNGPDPRALYCIRRKRAIDQERCGGVPIVVTDEAALAAFELGGEAAADAVLRDKR
jgi:uncharacterized protein YbaR (Trm112 family)